MLPPSCQRTYFDYCRMGICIDCSHPGTHESFFSKHEICSHESSFLCCNHFCFFGMLLIWPDQDHPWSFVSVKRQTGFSCSISISCPHLHEHAATSSRLIRWDKCGLMFCVSPVASVRYVKKVAGLWARIYIYVVIFWRENSWLRDASCFFLPKSLETFQTCMQWFAQTAWLGISGSSHVLVGSQQATLFKNVGEHYMWNVPCRVSKFVNWLLLWGPSSLARSSRMFDTKFNWRHPGSPAVWSPIRKNIFFNVVVCISVFILVGHMQRLVTPFV